MPDVGPSCNLPSDKVQTSFGVILSTELKEEHHGLSLVEEGYFLPARGDAHAPKPFLGEVSDPNLQELLPCLFFFLSKLLDQVSPVSG